VIEPKVAPVSKKRDYNGKTLILLDVDEALHDLICELLCSETPPPNRTLILTLIHSCGTYDSLVC
jgi:hypothetical protein